jgi:tetratricopeptide (TPR) repeat protein
MDCLACGHGNPDDLSHCEQCGAVLDVDAIQTLPPAPDSDEPTTPFGASDASEAPTLVGSLGSGAAPQPQFEMKAGAVLGNRFEITSVLGKGGMGIVYRARDLRLQRDVALKVIRPELLQQPEIGERFRREILLASKITHKNILRIHDLGESDGMSYISMAYVEGETLSERLERDGPVAPNEAAALSIQLCRALEAAHDAGVVHRDLKPQNVLIDGDGTAYIADFGISRSLESGDTMTQHGAVLGTLHYMAPEQARGETPDHRADIYSLGMVMYRMLVGKLPFDQGSSITGMLRRVQEDVPEIRTERRDVPPWLSAIIARALRRDLDSRYQSALEMQRDLEAHKARTSPFKLLKPRNLLRGAALLAAAALVTIAAFQAVDYFKNKQTPEAAAGVPGVPRASLALLPFINETGDASYDWIRSGVPDLLRTDLMRDDSLRLVDESRIDQIYEGLAIADDEELRPDMTIRIAGLVKADSVLVARLVRMGERLGILADLRSVSGGSIVSAPQLKVEGQGDESIFAMVEDLSKQIRQEIGIADRRGGNDRGITDLTTQSVAALKLYGEARDLVREGNNLEATEQFELALGEDPDFAAARVDLAETYDRLGFSDKALEQIQLASQKIQKFSPYEAARVQATKAKLEFDFEAAEAAYLQLVQIAPNSTETLMGLADVQMTNGDVEGALTTVERILELDPKHATAQLTLGRLKGMSGDLSGAKEQFENSLDSAIDSKNREAEADALHALGNYYFRIDRYDDGLTYYEKALKIRGAIGDRPGVADVTSMVGSTYHELGRYDEAIETMQHVVGLYRELGDAAGQAQAYSSLGEFHQASGHTSEALSAYEDALKLLRDIGDKAEEASTLSGIGYVNMVLGNYAQAHFPLQEALNRRRELGDKYDVALSLVDVGILEQVQGRYEQAIGYYLDARDVFRSENDMANATVCSANLANIREDQGDYGPALALLVEGETENETSGNLRMQTTALIYLGATRQHLGDLVGATTDLDEALELAHEMDNHELLAKALIYRSELAEQLDDDDTATRLAREAVDLAVETRDHRLQLIARLQAGRATRSVKELDTVAEQADSSDLKPLVAPARLALARIHLDSGRASAAQREAELAVAAAAPLGQRDWLFGAHHTLGKSLEAQNDREGALERYLAALAELEAIRQSVEGENLRFLVERPATVAFGQDAGELMQSMGRDEDARRLSASLAP